jgi:uncharacterized membrane protein YeiH
MSQQFKSTPKDDMRRGILQAILFGVLTGCFGLVFGAVVAQGPAAVYLSAMVYFACGLGMYFKVSRLAATVTLGLFTSTVVTFLVIQSEPILRGMLHS